MKFKNLIKVINHNVKIDIYDENDHTISSGKVGDITLLTMDIYGGREVNKLFPVSGLGKEDGEKIVITLKEGKKSK